MSYTPNKICLTQKGLEFVNDEKQELRQQNSNQQPHSINLAQSTSRTSSLPMLKSRCLIAQPKLIKQLSSLSKTKLKLEKIGLKTMGENQADEIVRKKLDKQFQGANKYIKSIIPQLVKMTKQKNQNSQLQSRFERARMYVSRLEQNFDLKFVFKPRKTPEPVC